MQSVIKTENPFFKGAPDTQIMRFSVSTSGNILSHRDGISIIGIL